MTKNNYFKVLLGFLHQVEQLKSRADEVLVVNGHSIDDRKVWLKIDRLLEKLDADTNRLLNGLRELPLESVQPVLDDFVGMTPDVIETINQALDGIAA